MPVYQDPVHPDCSIPCPGSGYAAYVRPDGPCHVDCGEDSVGDFFQRIITPTNSSARFSIDLAIDRTAVTRLLEIRGNFDSDIQSVYDAIEERVETLSGSNAGREFLERYQFRNSYNDANSGFLLSQILASLYV